MFSQEEIDLEQIAFRIIEAEKDANETLRRHGVPATVMLSVCFGISPFLNVSPKIQEDSLWLEAVTSKVRRELDKALAKRGMLDCFGPPAGSPEMTEINRKIQEARERSKLDRFSSVVRTNFKCG